MKRKRVWRIVSVALIVVWAVVIFSFSAQPDTESSEISGHVSYRIVKMWNQVFGWKHSGPELEQMAQKIEKEPWMYGTWHNGSLCSNR